MPILKGKAVFTNLRQLCQQQRKQTRNNTKGKTTNRRRLSKIAEATYSLQVKHFETTCIMQAISADKQAHTPVQR